MGSNLSSITYPGTHDPSFYEDAKTPYPSKDAISLMDALDQSVVRIKIVPDNVYLKSDNGYFTTTSDVEAAGTFLANVFNSSEIGFTYVPTEKQVYINTQDDESLTQGIYNGQEIERRFFLSLKPNSPLRLNLFSTPWPLVNGFSSPPVYLTPTGTNRTFGMTSSFRGWNIPESARKQVVFEMVNSDSPIVKAYKQFGSNPPMYSSDCCTGKTRPNTSYGVGLWRACFGNGLAAPGACDVYTRTQTPPPAPNSNPNDDPTINNANPNVGAVVPAAAPAGNVQVTPAVNTTAVMTPASTMPTWIYAVILLVIFAVLITIILSRSSKKNSEMAAPGSAAPPLPAVQSS